MNKLKFSLLLIALLLSQFIFSQVAIEGVKFSSYPAKVSNGKKAKIDYNSHSLGKLFKTAITEGYNESGVNFGGHYVAAFWGAGQGQTGGAIVDINTGKIYALPLNGDNSYRQTYYDDNNNIFYRANSNLFVCYRNEPSSQDPNLVNLYFHFYEWNDKTKKFSLLKKKNTIVKVDDDAIVTDVPTDVTVTLNQAGVITVGGKEVALHNLRKELQGRLVKYEVVPDEVPINYIGETGMGMRAEVRTEVNDAIGGAKWLKKKATITAKGVSATPSVTLNQKGEITVSGKKVALENLRKELQNELVKMAVIPAEIPLKTIGQTGMGMRAEVRTEITAAIKGAKWLKKKAALGAIKIESFTTFPPEIDGCACYFSSNFNDKKAKKYIYADNFDNTAFVRINGEMQKMALKSSSNKSASKTVKNITKHVVKTYTNDEFEVTLDIEQTGNQDEVWFYKGKMTVKNKNGQIISQEIIGECGC